MAVVSMCLFSFLQEGSGHLFIYSFISDPMLPFISKSNRALSTCNDWWILSPNLHSRRGEAPQESDVLVPFTLATGGLRDDVELLCISMIRLSFPLCLKSLVKVRRRRGWMSLLLFIFLSVESGVQSPWLVVAMTERATGHCSCLLGSVAIDFNYFLCHHWRLLIGTISVPIFK